MAIFYWGETKRQKNLKKRKLDFSDAPSVFKDDQALSGLDLKYSDDRWLLILFNSFDDYWLGTE